MKQTSLIKFFFIRVKYFSVFQAGLIRAPWALKNSDSQPFFGVSRFGVAPIYPFVVSVHWVTVVKQILGHPEFMFAFVAFFVMVYL